MTSKSEEGLMVERQTRFSEVAGGEELFAAQVEMTGPVWVRVGILADHHHIEPAAMVERLVMRSLSSLEGSERSVVQRAVTPAGSGGFRRRTGEWPPRSGPGGA